MKLPNDAKIGDVVEKDVKIKGKPRTLSFERVHAHGRRWKLKWKIIGNKPTNRSK